MEHEEEIKEIKESILTTYPNLIPFDCTKEIINQMERCICKIKIGDNRGTGFFCKIPFPGKENILKVLITNNHVINEDILNKKDEEIEIYIKEESDMKKLNLNDRIKYTQSQKEYDITIIEIKEKDKINNYLELDDNIINDLVNNNNNNNNNNNKNVEYIDKTFYIIQYPDGELSVSYGLIKGIYVDKKYKFNHTCNTKYGSSGSPILTLKNKVIGLHTGELKNYKAGTFLNYPIKDFIKEYYKQKDDKNVIDNKINELFVEKINNKFKLNIKNNINITNYKELEKYLGNHGFKELQELFFFIETKLNHKF